MNLACFVVGDEIVEWPESFSLSHDEWENLDNGRLNAEQRLRLWRAVGRETAPPDRIEMRFREDVLEMLIRDKILRKGKGLQGTFGNA